MTPLLRSCWIAAALTAAAPLQAKLPELSSPFVDRTAVVVRSAALGGLQHEAALLLRDSTTVSGRDIRQACFRFSHLQDALLVFTPDDKGCSTLAEFESQLPTARLDFGLSSTTGSASLEQQLGEFDMVAVMPTAQGGAVYCSCPGGGGGNLPPFVYVQTGSPQGALRATEIAEILFRASDANSDVLSGQFSHTFNGTPAGGLPVGLHQNCSASPGTLSCPVNGTAPEAPGSYLITLTVSDGTASRSATASLEVWESIQIFEDGFE